MEIKSVSIKRGLLTLIILSLLLLAVGEYTNVFSFFPLYIKNASVIEGSDEEYPLSIYDMIAYDTLTEAYVKEVHRDFNELARGGFYYQPWVQFSEPLFKSKRVNIVTDESGIPVRLSIHPFNSENLPVYRVYLFGSSATFGYNVSDEHTIASYLSEIMNKRAKEENLKMHIEVMNYGRGHYETSQEMQLLLDLFKLGHRPSAVVFLDGLTVGSGMDIPFYTEEMVKRFYQIQFNSSQRAKNPFLNFISSLKNGQSNTSEIAINNEPDSRFTDFYINRFTQNKEVIQSLCRIYNTDCFFFSQPNSFYNYPEEFATKEEHKSAEIRRAWKLLYDQYLSSNPDVVSLHNLFSKWGKKAIVDQRHYSPGFNQFIAQHIAGHLNLDSIYMQPFRLDTLRATGASRNIAAVTYEASRSSK